MHPTGKIFFSLRNEDTHFYFNSHFYFISDTTPWLIPGRIILNNSLVCPFSMDQNDACGTHGTYNEETCDTARTVESWHCRVSEFSVCNGFSSCLIDECRCEQEAFKCADGVGCIAMDNLCNGFKDCNDGSDECMCENTVTCYIDEVKFCVPEELYCKGRLLTYSKCRSTTDYEVTCSEINVDETSPMEECVENYFIKMWNQIDDNMPWEKVEATVFNNQTFLKFCVKNCDSSYRHFCRSLDIKMPGGHVFACGNQGIDLLKICDGNLDCSNGTDETDCPGRYQCTNTEVRLF